MNQKNQINSLFDENIDDLIKQPISKRENIQEPLKRVLISALWGFDLDTSDNFIEKYQKLQSLRKSLHNYEKEQLARKKKEVKKNALINQIPITYEEVKIKKPTQPKKLTPDQKEHYKNVFHALDLPDDVYNYTPYTSIVAYEWLYQKHQKEMELLYTHAYDVIKTIMEKYKYVSPASLNTESIYINRNTLLPEHLLQRLVGTNKRQAKMSLKSYMRERCEFLLLPTEERPYGVHPAYLFHIMSQYPDSVFSQKHTFSGIIGEICGNRALSWYKDKHHSIEHVELSMPEEILWDMLLKTDAVYKMIVDWNEQHPVWLAVDFKVKWFVVASKCFYNGKYPQWYTIKLQRQYDQLKKHVLKLTWSDIIIDWIECHVWWGTVDWTLFLPRFMEYERKKIVTSLLRVTPQSASYEIGYQDEFYNKKATESAMRRAKNPSQVKNPLEVDVIKPETIKPENIKNPHYKEIV